jgi:SEC-C motif-containing protein
MKKKPTEHCPCGGASYATCCEPHHNGAPAPTADALMRSRYSAYVLKLERYLLATWHPDTRPASLDLTDDATKWLGLDIKRHEADGDRAIVEFIARFKVGGRAGRLHETSRFVRDNGHWFYIDGTFTE